MRLERVLNKLRRAPSIYRTRPINDKTKILETLDMRLDYILYRMKFATTVPTACSLVSHQHVLVNGLVVNKPSYICRPSDIIALKDDPKSVAMIHNFLDSPPYERSVLPDASVTEVKEFKIFVSNLSPVVDDQALARAFIPCGDFIKAQVITDPNTGKSKNFGFVSFGSKQSMKEAARVMNRKYVNGTNISVREADNKQEKEKGSKSKSADGEKGAATPKESREASARKEAARREAEFTSTLQYCLEHRVLQKRRDLIAKLNESMRSAALS
uniref:RRM domain-containing protein n=1 Tax=Kalanchoe fedtschenkoi TaxID=63787 RepID=A0A7N0TDG1_KALFE